jgi:hypothetical protein
MSPSYPRAHPVFLRKCSVINLRLASFYIREFRVETLDPPFMSMARPTLSNVPSKIAFNQRVRYSALFQLFTYLVIKFTIGIDIPAGVSTSSIKGIAPARTRHSHTYPDSSGPHGPRIFISRIPLQLPLGVHGRRPVPEQTVSYDP